MKNSHKQNIWLKVKANNNNNTAFPISEEFVAIMQPVRGWEPGEESDNTRYYINNTQPLGETGK